MCLRQSETECAEIVVSSTRAGSDSTLDPGSQLFIAGMNSERLLGLCGCGVSAFAYKFEKEVDRGL
ncbi:MAG TPA: hypothetical protein VHA14_02890, partial [Bryobacteraceae bacterium]|nr:hypothetical protein [Bryobacteraceae bacterium]